MTVKVGPPLLIPAGVVTFTSPVTAPVGTVAVITPSETKTKPAETPPKETSVTPVNPEPFSVIMSPTLPVEADKVETTANCTVCTMTVVPATRFVPWIPVHLT